MTKLMKDIDTRNQTGCRATGKTIQAGGKFYSVVVWSEAGRRWHRKAAYCKAVGDKLVAEGKAEVVDWKPSANLRGSW